MRELGVAPAVAARLARELGDDALLDAGRYTKQQRNVANPAALAVSAARLGRKPMDDDAPKSAAYARAEVPPPRADCPRCHGTGYARGADGRPALCNCAPACDPAAVRAALERGRRIGRAMRGKGQGGKEELAG